VGNDGIAAISSPFIAPSVLGSERFVLLKTPPGPKMPMFNAKTQRFFSHCGCSLEKWKHAGKSNSASRSVFALSLVAALPLYDLAHWS
jgi:hypothetical protein